MKIETRGEHAMLPAMADDLAIPEDPPAPPPTRRRGRPVGDREGRRAELIAAALKVIAEEGFAAASLRKVAQRAGCTTGAVSYYFANKEAMMAAVIESRFDDFDSLLEIRGGLDGVRRMFERWLEMTNAEPGWIAGLQLLAYARHDPALAATYQRRYAHYRKILTGIMAEGQQQGWIRQDIPAEMLADQLSAMGDGWMMLYPIEPERFGADRVDALLDATTALISPR